MSALNQYLELFKEHRKELDDGSSAIINSRRDYALEVLQSAGLPQKGSEHYAVADIEGMLAEDFGVNIRRLKMYADPLNSFKCGVPNLPAYHYYVVNDALLPTEGLKDKMYVKSLCDASKDNGGVVNEYYNCVADANNPLVALNTLLVQDGLLIHIPKNVRVEKPLQIINILQSATPLMAIRRILVVMEENSEATIILCDHTQNAEIDFMSLQTVEIVAKSGAHLDWYDLEESTIRTRRINTLYTNLHANSHVLIDGITITNGCTRNEYYCKMCGEGSNLYLLGMGIEDNERVLDTYTKISHLVPHCESNELVKYVADDNARCGFEGMIYVAEGAVGTSSYQTNRNMLVGPDAKIHSRPQLEIYNDDVKCSHGCAIGQLDEKQLFYMQTRGIGVDTAKLLLKQAFMADVVNGVRAEALRQRLHIMVERRMSGDNAALCSSCGADCSEVKAAD